MPAAADIVSSLLHAQTLQETSLVLDLPGQRLAIRSNSAALLERLDAYFSFVPRAAVADSEVICLQRPVTDLGLTFRDWQREPGKSGRKDAIHELDDARLVQKVRTGMLFLQHARHRLALGPCLQHDNQVVNFINAQFMNSLQNNGALICHAAGLVMHGNGLGIAGFSGGGKSTLMLHLLELADSRFLTNDRLFVTRRDSHWQATGIPKLPRVNPGTLFHNMRLRGLLDGQRRAELEAMPTAQLWHLEEKHDVDIEQCYGHERIQPVAPLSAFLLLDWHFDSHQACRIEAVDIQRESHLLQAVMKSPGPFYQHADGHFFSDSEVLPRQPYLDFLTDVQVYRASGRVDFGQAVAFCQEHMTGEVAA